MPPKPRQAKISVRPQTHGVSPRCVQTSGIFTLPPELIIKILSYFGDPHHNIFLNQVRFRSVVQEHVERLTVTRKLTMTCWHLRNMLFPLLWEYVEGCHRYYKGHPAYSPSKGLYRRCTYLTLNPAVGTYVRALSAEFDFSIATKDSTFKVFVDCIAQLPNLRVLEIYNSTDSGPITRVLTRGCAQFPNIRELTVGLPSMRFVESCPNLESVRILGHSSAGIQAFVLCGKGLKGLKRIAGVCSDYILRVVQCFPNLQEIGIRSPTGSISLQGPSTDTQNLEHLRSLKRLAIMEIALIRPSYETNEPGDPTAAWSTEALRAWKAHSIEILRDSPSAERKFLKWEIYGGPKWGTPGVAEIESVMDVEGVLEVEPDTSLEEDTP